MDNGTGGAGASPTPAELPPGLARWFGIEQAVRETIDALPTLGGDWEEAEAFLWKIHALVRTWASWELWTKLLDPDRWTPDGLLQQLLERDPTDIRFIGCFGPLIDFDEDLDGTSDDDPSVGGNADA